MPRSAVLTATLVAASLLTGCGLGTPATSTPETVHLNITGSVHGGQQPVAGARIFVFQANNTGYGATSKDLIGNDAAGNSAMVQGGGLDATYNAYYVPTNAGGNFSITGDYFCLGTGPVYLLATQGNPGLGSGKSNRALAELAVVSSSCGNGSTLSAAPNIGITEQSTVTGIYALAGYMTAPNKVSSTGGTVSLSETGITNAANTALGLADLPSGTPLAITAAGATMPTAKINLLADILAACVNTDSTGTPCSTLFTAATPAGGTKPTDTVTALLNIAHNPALTPASLSSLYSLVASTAPYQPYSTAPPTDLTLSLTYPVTGCSAGINVTLAQPVFDAAGRLAAPSSCAGSNSLGLTLRDSQGKDLGGYLGVVKTYKPVALTVDPSDRSWLIGSMKTANVGAEMERDTHTDSGTSSTTYFSNGIDSAYAIASDASGNIFLAGNNNKSVTEFNSSGVPGNTYLAENQEAATGLALDNLDDLFTTSPTSNTLSAISITPNASNGFGDTPNFTSSTNLNQPSTLAVDSAGSVWVTNLGNSTIAKFIVVQMPGSSGSAGYFYPALFPATNAYTGGGMSFAAGSTGRVPIVMDGASAAWVPNYTGQSISAFSNTGTALSPATYGFATPGCQAQGVAVDGSGNVWVTCDTGSPSAVEFLGLATPVATPILPGQLGVRP